MGKTYKSVSNCEILPLFISLLSLSCCFVLKQIWYYHSPLGLGCLNGRALPWHVGGPRRMVPKYVYILIPLNFFFNVVKGISQIKLIKIKIGK